MAPFHLSSDKRRRTANPHQREPTLLPQRGAAPTIFVGDTRRKNGQVPTPLHFCFRRGWAAGSDTALPGEPVLRAGDASRRASDCRPRSEWSETDPGWTGTRTGAGGRAEFRARDPESLSRRPADRYRLSGTEKTGRRNRGELPERPR